MFKFERNPSTEHAFSTIHDTTIFGAFSHFLTFLEIEWYFGSFNMIRVANSVNWMHYKPLHSLNGTILAMNSPSGRIFQLVLIYIGPGFHSNYYPFILLVFFLSITIAHTPAAFCVSEGS